jgi:hypothetical protein
MLIQTTCIITISLLLQFRLFVFKWFCLLPFMNLKHHRCCIFEKYHDYAVVMSIASSPITISQVCKINYQCIAWLLLKTWHNLKIAQYFPVSHDFYYRVDYYQVKVLLLRYQFWWRPEVPKWYPQILMWHTHCNFKSRHFRQRCICCEAKYNRYCLNPVGV